MNNIEQISIITILLFFSNYAISWSFDNDDSNNMIINILALFAGFVLLSIVIKKFNLTLDEILWAIVFGILIDLILRPKLRKSGIEIGRASRSAMYALTYFLVLYISRIHYQKRLTSSPF